MPGPSENAFHNTNHNNTACQQLWALTMTGISVPQMADVKDVVKLTCTYEMGRTKLNSVKWYKEGSEFFR